MPHLLDYALTLCLLASVPPGVAPDGGTAEPAPRGTETRESSSPLSRARPLPREHDLLARARVRADGRWVVARGEGEEELLTIRGRLQSRLQEILKTYAPPYAAVVVLEPRTGRVLAMVEHSQLQPDLRGLTTKAIFPAASVFKIVTAAALLKAGVDPSTTTCFHGGKRRLNARLLVDSERDHQCYDLRVAMGRSANVVFAKLTSRHLTAEKLEEASRAFGFNKTINFPVPTDVSVATIPGDPFALAATGAGFGAVYLSPLHGAMIASVTALEGVWKPPVLFERDVETAEAPEQVLPVEHARAINEMLESTVTEGTARRIFRERGFRVPGAVGKTGSLADRSPFRDYSWFVGFTAKDDPKVAVGAVVVNDEYWRIRATWLGREALRLALETAEPMLAGE